MSPPLLRLLPAAALRAASCSNAVGPNVRAFGGDGGAAGATLGAAGSSTPSAGTPPVAGAEANGGARGGRPGTGEIAGGSSSAGLGGSAGEQSAGGRDAVGGDGGSGGGGGVLDACAGAFCEDFESGRLDPAIWSVQANQGQTVEVQPALAAHGRYSVRFHGAPNVVSYDFIIASHLPATLNEHLFGRAYFYITPKPPEKHTEFLFAGTHGFPKLKYLEVAESGLGWQLTYVRQIAPTGESYTPATGSVPLTKWACLEWEMNDVPDQIHLSVDGVPTVKFDDITFMSQQSGLVGGFGEFGVGYYIWHPTTYAFDVYYDDLVLDTKPIGCLR